MEENCILSSVANDSTFEITHTKLYVTLKTEDNTKLSKLLSEGFKRPVYWNECKVIPNKPYNANDYKRERLHASLQGVKRLFVLPYASGDNVTDEDSYLK